MSAGSSASKPSIACLPNGPYYLLHDLTPAVVPNLQNAKGESLSSVRGVALCRCGGSKNKPFCDGTHGTNGFSDKKLTDGKLNKRVRYRGKNITIYDNRGIARMPGIAPTGSLRFLKCMRNRGLIPTVPRSRKSSGPLNAVPRER